MPVALARIAHGFVGWDKERVIWWAGACHRAFCVGNKLFPAKLPFPPAHQQLKHACHPTYAIRARALTITAITRSQQLHDHSN